MAYLDAFKGNDSLIKSLGEGNAHMIWALALYLEESDFDALASEALTDGNDDKKIDFVYLDRVSERVVFAQGYYAKTGHESAPSNKASDLNTAAAWLFSGDPAHVPAQLRPVLSECRAALDDGEVKTIELLYVHNLPESVNVAKELNTAREYLRKSLGGNDTTTVIARELGSSRIEHLFATQESHIAVKDEILCPALPTLTEKGPDWDAGVFSVPGVWLHELFETHGDALFSANYRGFLGITKRRKINTEIRSTAEGRPQDFWVYNNGITLLTLGMKPVKDGTRLTGVSIINGAQTTGSIGSVDADRHDLKAVRVLCRVIQCQSSERISDIVKYNNTQNEIRTWDQYANDAEQVRIEKEFADLGKQYSRKRGFHAKAENIIGIEEVAQPLLAFQSRFQDANRSRNIVFERAPQYKLAFEGRKARHILFVHALSRAIDARRIDLKEKSTAGKIISVEEDQLKLLRNLRFKYFLISVVAKCLEPVLNAKVSVDTVGFSSEAAKNQTIIELVAAWVPVVETLLSLVATQVTAERLPDELREEGIVDRIARAVSGIVYASKAHLNFDAFRTLVLPT